MTYCVFTQFHSQFRCQCQAKNGFYHKFNPSLTREALQLKHQRDWRDEIRRRQPPVENDDDGSDDESGLYSPIKSRRRKSKNRRGSPKSKKLLTKLPQPKSLSRPATSTTDDEERPPTSATQPEQKEEDVPPSEPKVADASPAEPKPAVAGQHTEGELAVEHKTEPDGPQADALVRAARDGRKTRRSFVGNAYAS